MLKTDEIKIKYKYIQKFIKNLGSQNKETISILNIEYDIINLLQHINNIEYLIFSELKENGGLDLNMNILNYKLNLTEQEQDIIYNKLFDMIIVNRDIYNPLCNCCLAEYNTSYESNISTDTTSTYTRSTWMTSKCYHKELYKHYISHNYLHICNKCNLLLKQKLKKYYDSLQLIPMTQHEFNKQTAGFMKYQSLIFNLLFNYNIINIKKVLN